MGHRRDVPSGDLWACAAFGAGGGTEPARGSAGVWDLAQDDPEDASLCGSAGISAAAAGEAPEAGAVVGRHRRHSGRRPAETGQATAYSEADLRPASGRARVPGRLHDREGLRAHSYAAWTGDVRAVDPRRG